MRYGFIGLGNLGVHLAGSLLREGFSLTVHDLNKAAANALIAAGARWAESPKTCAAASDAVITCLPSPAASRAVLTGESGVLEGLQPGCTWIEMSTNDRHEIEAIAALAAKKAVEAANVAEKAAIMGALGACRGHITPNALFDVIQFGAGLLLALWRH